MSRKEEGRAQAGPMESGEQEGAPAKARGNTVSAQGETQEPRPQMPHERDESASSQAADNPAARRMGEMAHDDVVDGQQDTSKSQEMDATYHAMRKGTDPAPVEKPDRNQRGN